MNTFQTHAIATRAACLLAAVAVTTLIVGSQLGIAVGYATQADTALAAKSAQQPVAQQASPQAKPQS
jgi:hypothetical protein